MHAALARDLAAYNRWMNQRLYAACASLSDEVRKQDRGSFFKSIHATLNHLLLADRIWMSRFQGTGFAFAGLDQELYADFAVLRAEREATDQAIVDWAGTLTDEGLAGVLQYTRGSDQQRQRYEMWLVVSHFFNHQTHHRGQLTTLLSQCGVDYGVTDLIRLPQVLARQHD